MATACYFWRKRTVDVITKKLAHKRHAETPQRGYNIAYVLVTFPAMDSCLGDGIRFGGEVPILIVELLYSYVAGKLLTETISPFTFNSLPVKHWT